MKPTSSPGRCHQSLSAALLVTALAIASVGATAAPGAHGPNGEHLDGPGNAGSGSALPRVEAKSEAFELVAEMRRGELAILIDRYDTNEPVLGAKLEVESGTRKGIAAYRAEQGDYAVTDAPLLKALSEPGEHPLVFTLVAGKDSDLLDGTLVSARPPASAADDDGHSHGLERAAWIGAGIAVLGLLGGVAWWCRRRLEGAAPRRLL